MTANTSDNGLGLSSPMNVEQIVKRAQNFDYNPSIPLKYWLRTAGTLVKEVGHTVRFMFGAYLTSFVLGRDLRA